MAAADRTEDPVGSVDVDELVKTVRALMRAAAPAVRVGVDGARFLALLRTQLHRITHCCNNVA